MKQTLLFSGAGVLFIVTTGLAYIPKFINQGFAGIELTFLANFSAALLLLIDIVLKKKNKYVRQGLYLASTGILICVMLISVACIGEANFSGPFIFLHVINPLLATALTITYTYHGAVNFAATFLGTFAFSVAYIVYAVSYGWYTGDWLYSIINIEEKGFVFVILLFIGLMAVLVGLEYGLHKLSYRIHRKSER